MRYSGRIVALAGLLTALGLATDASAQPPQVDQSPQIGSALAVTSQTPFQQYAFRDPCPGNPCTVNFTTVPINSRLNITNTSCYIKTDAKSLTQVDALQLLLINKNKIATASTLVPFSVSQTSTFIVYSANHPVAVFANAGQHFQAFLSLTSSIPSPLFACHISGQLQKLG
jgi:hypothetical protein